MDHNLFDDFVFLLLLLFWFIRLVVVFFLFTSGPFESIANSGATAMVKYWPAGSKNTHKIRNGVIANVCVENQRHRNRKLYASKRIACVLDLSRIHTHTHTHNHTHTNTRNFIVSMRLTMNSMWVKIGRRERLGWCGGTSGAHCGEKKSKPFTINSYFDGFYKIYTVKQMV